MKTQTGWVIVSANGRIDLTTVAYTRKEAIAKWLTGGSKNWKWYYNRGCRAERCTVTI